MMCMWYVNLDTYLFACNGCILLVGYTNLCLSAKNTAAPSNGEFNRWQKNNCHLSPSIKVSKPL